MAEVEPSPLCGPTHVTKRPLGLKSRSTAPRLLQTGGKKCQWLPGRSPLWTPTPGASSATFQPTTPRTDVFPVLDVRSVTVEGGVCVSGVVLTPEQTGRGNLHDRECERAGHVARPRRAGPCRPRHRYRAPGHTGPRGMLSPFDLKLLLVLLNLILDDFKVRHAVTPSLKPGQLKRDVGPLSNSEAVNGKLGSKPTSVQIHSPSS